MATADTIIRVSESDAAWLNGLRDQYSLASVAAVVSWFRSHYGSDFEEVLRQARHPGQRAHDLPA